MARLQTSNWKIFICRSHFLFSYISEKKRTHTGSQSKLLTSGYIVGSDDITSSELPRHHNHLDHLIAILERQQLVWLHDLVSLFTINIAIPSRRNITSRPLLHSIHHCCNMTSSNLATSGLLPGLQMVSCQLNGSDSSP